MELAAEVRALMPSSLYTEGLTEGALQELLDGLDQAAEQGRTKLFRSLETGLDGPSSATVLSCITGLAELPSSSGAEQQAAQYAQQLIQLQLHIDALQAEAKAAQAAADLEATQREFKACIDNGQFNDAAYSLVQLRKILEDSTAQAAGKGLQGPDLLALQSACTACERSLEEALESSLAEAFDVSRESQCITITCTLPSGGDVADLWAAMALAGSLERHMVSVAGVLLEVLQHVLTGMAYLSIQTTDSAALLQWYGTGPQPDGTYDTSHVESIVMQLLSVLAQCLFRQQPSTLAAFGAAFWAPFVGQYEAAFVTHIQGSSVALLQARQEAARSMEQTAVAMGLAEPGSDLASCLSRSVQQSYHAVQEAFLASARETLMAYDPRAEPVVVGQPLPVDASFVARAQRGELQSWEVLDPPSGFDTSGPVLATGYYTITPTAMQLVMTMDDALAKACHQGEASYAQAVAGAVSKMATMFATMLPQPSDADPPTTLLLRYNDLRYIARHLLLVPFLFNPEMEPLLQAKLWFGDQAVELRRTASSLHLQLLNSHKASLQAPLQELVGLSAALATTTLPLSKRGEDKSAAAAAVKQLLHGLGRSGRLMWGALMPSEALEASQALVEHVAGAVLRDLLGKQDIGEAEAQDLEALYSPLLQGLLQAVLSEADLSTKGIQLEGLDLTELVSSCLAHRCCSLGKAQRVLGLLQCRLADIVGAWEADELSRCGLSLPEVEGLVRALFEDTDYRAECLQRIEVAAETA